MDSWLWIVDVVVVVLHSYITMMKPLRRLQCTVATARRHFSSNINRIVDLRSDTVTQPTSGMLSAATQATTGDDVMGEDPTVNELEAYAADLFGKEDALFVPTGTMGNLCAIMAHCHYNKSAEIILGKKSHINLYEGGGYANIAGVSCKQIDEDESKFWYRYNSIHAAYDTQK